jgi:O-antigen/teichoic acid export membrane protein
MTLESHTAENTEAVRGQSEAGSTLIRRLKAAAWVLSGSGLHLAFGLLANLIIINSLAPVDFGRVSAALAVMTVLQEVCGGGADIAVVRYTALYLRSDRDSAYAILRSCFWIKLVVNGVVTLALWALAGVVATHLLRDPALTGPLRWAAIGVFGSSFFNLSLATLQAEERFKAYAAFRGSINIARLAIVLVAARLHSLTISLALFSSTGLYLLAYFGGFLISRPRYLRVGSGRRVSDHWRKIARFAGWASLANLLFNMYSRADILALQRLMPSEVPVYSVATSMVFLMDLTTYSVMVTLLPEASRLVTGQEFRAYLSRTFIQCALLALALLPLFFLAEPAIRLVFSAVYLRSAHIFRILFWGCFASMLLYPMNLVLYSRNRGALVAAGNGVQFVLAAAGYFALTPRYGAEGTAWSAVAGRLAACIVFVGAVLWDNGTRRDSVASDRCATTEPAVAG